MCLMRQGLGTRRTRRLLNNSSLRTPRLVIESEKVWESLLGTGAIRDTVSFGARVGVLMLMFRWLSVSEALYRQSESLCQREHLELSGKGNAMTSAYVCTTIDDRIGE